MNKISCCLLKIFAIKIRLLFTFPVSHKEAFDALGEGFLNLSFFFLCSHAVITAEFEEHIHVRTLYFLIRDNWYVQVIIFLSVWNDTILLRQSGLWSKQTFSFIVSFPFQCM